MTDAPAPDPAALAAAGLEHLRAQRPQAAEDALREALRVAPRHPSALRNLGVLLMEGARHDEALAAADAMLAAEATHREALLLRGSALSALSRFEEAVATHEAALAARPDDVEALTQLGLAQASLGWRDAAMASLDRAVALRPGDAFARTRRGTLRLQLRDFSGWDDYEARLDLARFVSRSGGIITPELAAELVRRPTTRALAGRRVLLLGEQGIGDEIMFASMIPDLARVAGHVTCVCDARLARLFAQSFPKVRMVSPRDARISRADIDDVLAIGSLGAMFRTREADFPGLPYLRPDATVQDRWAHRLGPRSDRLRVGLSWRGGLPGTRRNARSLSLEQLRPLLDVGRCEFVSLQYGDVEAEVAAAGAPLRVFPAQDLHDFEGLAGLVANLDVVVSVQTALVHLCGAIGQDCLTLVPHNAEWRYGAAGPSMPWYGSVRLLRQAEPGDWSPVIAQAVEALRSRL